MSRRHPDQHHSLLEHRLENWCLARHRTAAWIALACATFSEFSGSAWRPWPVCCHL